MIEAIVVAHSAGFTLAPRLSVRPRLHIVVGALQHVARIARRARVWSSRPDILAMRLRLRCAMLARASPVDAHLLANLRDRIYDVVDDPAVLTRSAMVTLVAGAPRIGAKAIGAEATIQDALIGGRIVVVELWARAAHAVLVRAAWRTEHRFIAAETLVLDTQMRVLNAPLFCPLLEAWWGVTVLAAEMEAYIAGVTPLLSVAEAGIFSRVTIAARAWETRQAAAAFHVVALIARCARSLASVLAPPVLRLAVRTGARHGKDAHARTHAEVLAFRAISH
jgi:hypothetical protein